MAGKKSHGYRKPYGKRPYLKKKEWIILLSILGAILAAIAVYLIAAKLLDDSLPVKNGIAVTGDGDWILVNEGNGDNKKYYKYCSYDFSSLNADIETTIHTSDENLKTVYIYPKDGAYDYACVYASTVSIDELAESVHSQLEGMLSHSEISPVTRRSFIGRNAKTYWYTTYTSQTDTEGNVIIGEDGEEVRLYSQVFCCYLEAPRGGTIISRLGFETYDENEYLDEETAFGYIEDVLKCISIEEY